VIFVDTSFWYALIMRRDRRHREARRLFEARGEGQLVSTNHVQGETWTLMNYRDGHQAAMTFLSQTESTERLALHFVSSEVEDDAWEWLRRHDERPYSFVDATSFALMRRLRIREALAFDGDFAAAGFVELRP
jgi:uncharacterized protein